MDVTQIPYCGSILEQKGSKISNNQCSFFFDGVKSSLKLFIKASLLCKIHYPKYICMYVILNKYIYSLNASLPKVNEICEFRNISLLNASKSCSTIHCLFPTTAFLLSDTLLIFLFYLFTYIFFPFPQILLVLNHLPPSLILS